MTSSSIVPLEGRQIRVLHKQWNDDVLILESSSRLRHASHGTMAEYREENEILYVNWDDYESEIFVKSGEIYVDICIYRDRGIDLRFVQTAEIDDYKISISSVVIKIPGSDYLAELRPASSDIDVFKAVFFDGEYNRPDLQFPIKMIIDLGANIGLSAIFYAERYPDATILALEPEIGNFKLLARNLSPFPKVTCLRAAAWSSDTPLKVQTTEVSGQQIDHWGYRVGCGMETNQDGVTGITMPSLIKKYAISFVDILKIDIEGAEFELFERNTDLWLPYTKCIIIETHDRFRPGVDQMITSKLAADFDEQEPNGENRIFVRRDLYLSNQN